MCVCGCVYVDVEHVRTEDVAGRIAVALRTVCKCWCIYASCMTCCMHVSGCMFVSVCMCLALICDAKWRLRRRMPDLLHV